ncbi:MAG TPA: lamin tail domain-containing protein [Bacteroidales bacterium]|nr:lamin tail domain-containing protein [Bacteroidales bacterium]
MDRREMQVRKHQYPFIIILIILAFDTDPGSSQSETIRLNEFLALNAAGLTDEDGDHSDWIEIYNPSSEDIDLQNWSLTDDRNKPRLWIFPDMTLKKDCYLVVFASGKDRKAGELHTNFRLSGDGEYLALYNPSGKAVTEFNPFPLQQADVSYGFSDGSFISFTLPTPGAGNNQSAGIIPSPPVLSRNHGFYDSPFILSVSAQAGMEVYYSTDGSSPSASTGILYTGPFIVSKTSVIRAVYVKNGQSAGRVSTATYLFPEDIIHQPANPQGYPSTWGKFLSISGDAPADYEMDPQMMADPNFAASVKEALKDLPVVSLVTNSNNLFSPVANPQTGGIYMYTGTAGSTGDGWERPVSFEYFDASGTVSFQADCGIQIHGGESRRPEKTPKHSFLLTFKDEYGPSKLNMPIFGDNAAGEHNNLVLRAGFGNTWTHWLHSERLRAQYIRDRWTKDTQLAMGHPASHGNYAHLFINGLYWGIYNPSERLDSDFAETYLGGSAGEYDVIKDYAEAVDGYVSEWNSAITMANAGLSGDAAYQRILGNNPDGSRNPSYSALVDPVSLADYMILNFYGGNTDWDHHNWVAMRNRVNPGSGFRFFSWDAEHVVEDQNANMLNENNDKCPSRIFQQMRQNRQFRTLFADRVQKYCFNNGVLTPARSAERWMFRADQIDKAILAESARWGDYRRDVHPYQGSGPYFLYTKENWIAQQNYLINTYFPQRTQIFINQLRSAGLFPAVNAPVLLINGQPYSSREIKINDVLSMSAEGAIYYTTNGKDPVTWGSTPSLAPGAIQYNQPLILNGSLHIRARVLSGNEWSAASEEFFIFPGDLNNIRVTEINYHPLDEINVENKEFEFIEIKNTGASAVDMGGVQVSGAIEYVFPAGTHLGPGALFVLASNTREFFNRYEFLPFGEFTGHLDNNSETVFINAPSGDTLCIVPYEDSNGWPAAPDGEGKTLVPNEINPASDQTLPESWRESWKKGGSPGEDDLYVLQTGEKGNIATFYQNYPNPFTGSTWIRYSLKENAHVQLLVIDLSGKVVSTLEDSEKDGGTYEAEWHGTNDNHSPAENGLYFCKLIVRDRKGHTDVFTRKMVLIR